MITTIKDKLNSVLTTKKELNDVINIQDVEILPTEVFNRYPNKVSEITITNTDQLAEYFKTTVVSGTSEASLTWAKSIKKLPAITNTGTMKLMFRGFTGQEIDTSKLDFTKTTTTEQMFQDCTYITSLDSTDWDLHTITRTHRMFYSCINLINLDVSKWNTENITNMSNMFESCSKLSVLDVSNWNTSKVTNMNQMFAGCRNLTILGINNWDVSKVASMSSMFNDCDTITELDLSSWNTESLTSMTSMFSYANNLKSINLTNFNTSKVTSMTYLFQGCNSLENIDLSSFDTSKVTSMTSIIEGCGKLTVFDMSNFNLEKINQPMNFAQNSLYSLKTLRFGYNLGKGYTSKTANYSNYKVSLNRLTGLSADSLISVIDGLYDLNLTYDVANGGTLYTQQLILGSQHIATLELTPEGQQAIENAIAKGWNIS